MKLILYSANYSLAKKIQNILNCEQDIYDLKIAKMEILDREALINAEHIYIDWDIRQQAVNKFHGILRDKTISFYNDNFLSDIDECEHMVELLNNAFSSKNWKLCKSINEFLKYGDFIRKRKKLRCLPDTIQIESTDICNAKCIMCSHMYDSGTGSDIFETGIISKLQDILPFVRKAILHGNGEPFIKKNLVDYLKMLAEYDISFIANTNLSIISDDLLELFENYFLELNVSCDGHTKELYESIRRGLSFETFISNSKRVREYCPNLYMKLDAVVMRQNIPFLEDIVCLASELGFNEVVFNMLCVDKKNNNLNDSPLLYIDDYKMNIKNAAKRGSECGIKVTYFNVASNNISDNHCNSGAKRDENGICDWLLEAAYIDLKGRVGICCINQNVIMGNVFFNDFKDIWNGEEYQKIRKCMYDGEIPKFCYGCDFILQNRLKFITSEAVDEKVTRNKLEREMHRYESGIN